MAKVSSRLLRVRGDKGKRARLSRVVRDSFTMPETDYALIAKLKARCLLLGIAIKKSELLRAGLSTLANLSDESLAQVADAVERVKTGRPGGGKKKRKKKKHRARGRKR